MGTTWSAQIVAPPAGIEAQLHDALARVVASMSQWNPASALSRFNRAPVGGWHRLPADLTHVLDAALAIGAASGGAFDPAGGRLTDLWGFGPPGPRDGPPDAAAIAGARTAAAGDAIERSGSRTRRTADVALDLSGIAKGHAVDRLAQTLTEAGAADFLVEIGGEFVGAGIRPDCQPWWVELEQPPGLSLPPLRIALHGLAVATSGDYRRFIADGERRLSHSIDPATGRPIDNGVVSTSVIAADCMTADGWATALTVLGAEAGMACADRQALAVRMILRDGREYCSAALSAMLE